MISSYDLISLVGLTENKGHKIAGYFIVSYLLFRKLGI
jgi:hypothetical protein